MRSIKFSHASALGGLAGLALTIPNVNWSVFLPALVVVVVWASAYFRLPQHSISYLAVVVVSVWIVSIVSPPSLKYNLLFLLVLLASVYVGELWRTERFRVAFLNAAAASISVGILLEIYFNVAPLLQSRPEFDSHIYGILRQRGLFSEPAHLGYWCALLAFMSIVWSYYWRALIFLICLVLAFSAASFLYFFLLLAASVVRMSYFRSGVALLGAFSLIYLSREYIINKFKSPSFYDRSENFLFSSEYISNIFPWPAGFGPIFLDGSEVGIISGILLFLKAFGGFVVLFIPYFFLRRGRGAEIIPFAFLVAAVSNFWEVPIMLSLFLATPSPAKAVRQRCVV